MAIPNMPRQLTVRERLTDILYFILQLGAKLAWLPAGIIGYTEGGVISAGGCIIVAVVVGFLVSYSMGVRRWNQNDGYFVRMRQRANGSRRGLLEFMIEKLRGNEFSREQCRAIAEAYDSAVERQGL